MFSEVLVHSSGMCPSRYMGNTVMVLLSWKLALPPGRFNVLLPTGRTRPYSIGWNDWTWGQWVVTKFQGQGRLCLSAFLVQLPWPMDWDTRGIKFWITLPSMGAHSAKAMAEAKGNMERMVEKVALIINFGLGTRCKRRGRSSYISCCLFFIISPTPPYLYSTGGG